MQERYARKEEIESTTGKEGKSTELLCGSLCMQHELAQVTRAAQDYWVVCIIHALDDLQLLNMF